MAKTFVRISLATKFRVLFASAVVVIIAAALAVPWWVTERLVDDAAAGEARQIASLGLAEWIQHHPDPAEPPCVGPQSLFLVADVTLAVK